MEDVYVRLRHTCATLEEYRSIQSPSNEGIGRKPMLTVTNASSDKFDLWVRVLDMSLSETRTISDYLTIYVDIHAPDESCPSIPSSTLPTLTRMVVAVAAPNKRNQSSYPTSLDLWFADDTEEDEKEDKEV